MSKNLFCIIKCIKEAHLKSIIILLNNILKNVGKYSKEVLIQPFNVILATSDIYYYENYHSDIIAYILENKLKTIPYFIDFINSCSDKTKINKENYSNVEIVREENKIDILIKDNKSMHCIIIENKINNAGDMPRQLPRYYKLLLKKDYKVDAILYLSIDGLKRPDKSTWTNMDMQLGLDKLLVFAAASSGENNDLVNSFLAICNNKTIDNNEKSFYYQYTDLLNYLRRNQMDYQIMDKFYDEMLNSEQYKTALSIRDMLNDFISFRRDKIHNKFVNNYMPFEKTSKWSHNCTYFQYIREIKNNENIKIDIYTEEDKTIIYFYIQEPKIKVDLIEVILETIKQENIFTKQKNNHYCLTFKFPEEDEKMFNYIQKFLELLNKHKDVINISKN